MDNPFQPPSADLEVSRPEPTSAAEIRRDHKEAEKRVYAASWLFLCLAMIGVLLGVVHVVNNPDLDSTFLAFCVLPALFSVLIAFGLKSFDARAQIGALLLSFPLFLFIPIGPIVAASVWYTMLSKRGRAVFSAEYRDVRRATPKLDRPWRPVMSLVYFGVFLLVVFLIFAFVWWFTRRS